jgi:hypothetical protein
MVVVLIGWFLFIALHVWMVVYRRRFKLDTEDNLLARKHVTQSRILDRIATDLKESTMEIRMLVSASSAARAFDLRCEVREKMIAYVQQRHPQALPRVRTDLSDRRAGPDGASAH